MPCATTLNPANGAVAIGNSNVAVGQGSVALGNASTALAAGSVALGDTASAAAGNTIAIGSQSLDGAHLVPIGHDRQRRAGFDRLAIDVHHAGAALRGVAADMGAG